HRSDASVPYDHTEIARQIAASRDQALAAQSTRADAALDAAEIYEQVDHDAWCEAIDGVQSKRLMAVPRTPLHTFTPGRPAAPHYTVIATDSSFIPPDKHRGAYCY